MDPRYELDPHQEELRMFFMSDGDRNCMQRRCDVLIDQLGPFNDSDLAIIGSGIRTMSTAEGSDVLEGMTTAEYMEEFIVPRLADTGLRTITTTPSEKDDKVMDAMAYRARHHLDTDTSYMDETPIMILASNAGAWSQDGGRLRRALGRVLYPHVTPFELDELGEEFFVVSDSFPLGTGVESETTHQHPLSALGMIVCGAQEVLRHIA